MSNEQPSLEEFNDLIGRFIDLANTMSNEGKPNPMINAAMMSASGIYATFLTAGNRGVLLDTGIDKVLEMYKKYLVFVQQHKRQGIEGGTTQK